MPPNSEKRIVHREDTIQSISVIDLPKTSDDKNRILSYDDALEEIGFGKVQIQLLFVIALILIAVINETMGIAFLIPAAQCDFSLTTERKGLLTGMTFFGIMVSSYFWGFLGDTQGRRRIILFSLFCSVVLTIISTFLKSFTLFLVCRFASGVFVSGYSATVYAFIGEFNSNKNRATMISWVSVAIGASSIFQPLCALWILSYDWRFELYDGYEFRPWRLLVLIYATPGVIGGLFLYKLPESPKYLLSQDRGKEALEIVQWIYRTNKGEKSHEGLRIGSLISEAGATPENKHKGFKAFSASLVDQTFPIFKPPYLLKFIACSVMHFGTFAIGGGIGSFLPDTLNKLQKSRELGWQGGQRICDLLQVHQLEKPLNSNETNFPNVICDDSVDPGVFIDSAIIGVAFVLGFIVVSVAIKPLGRRKIFVFTLLTSAVSGIVLTLVSSHYLIIMFFCFFILFAGINVTLINGAACDIFPTHLRAMTVCISMMFGRLGTALATNVIGSLLEQNCELTFYIFSGVVLVCFAVSFALPS